MRSTSKKRAAEAEREARLEEKETTSTEDVEEILLEIEDKQLEPAEEVQQPDDEEPEVIPQEVQPEDSQPERPTKPVNMDYQEMMRMILEGTNKTMETLSQMMEESTNKSIESLKEDLNKKINETSQSTKDVYKRQRLQNPNSEGNQQNNNYVK